MIEDEIDFVVVTDPEFSIRIAYAYLEDIKNEWFTRYGPHGKNAQPYSMNYVFVPVIQVKMVRIKLIIANLK